MTTRRAVMLAALLTLAACAAYGQGRDLIGARPEIRGCTLWADGRPIYLSGVWIGGTVSTDPRLHKPDLDGDHTAYARLLSEQTAPLLGINSAHPPMSALRVMRPTGWFTEDRHTQPRWDGLQAFVRGLRQLPVIVDCADIKAFSGQQTPAELRQVNPHWHSFVPLCPERPDAWALYEQYWQDCARQVLEAGANAFAYELFNEPAYHCRCELNKRDFAGRMRDRHGDIRRANDLWSTDFASFDDVARMEAPEATPGLWCDWLQFIGDRYAEILAAGRQAIKSVDRREPMYFLDQPAISMTYLRACGIDPVKVSAAMDIVGMEGGVSFGESVPQAEDDPMAAVFQAAGLFGHQLYLDMARAFGKPVVNTETYCGRFYGSVRFPSHRQDILTELWEEMMHGAAGSYFYNWGRRWWEWNDIEGAKRAAREIGYKAYSMLNPYAYPPESLEGLRDFQQDMELVGDDLLSGPRIEGQVALIISQPTIRQVFRGRSYTEAGPYEETVRAWYTALTLEQIPVDIVWEEQLAEADLIRYRALLAPAMEHAYRASETPLRRYAEAGRRIIATRGALARDEYGRPWAVQDGREQAMPVKAEFIDEAGGLQLQETLREALLGAGDFRHFRVLPDDDPGRPLICKAHRVRRPAGDYYYIVNWETTSRLARLRVPDAAGRPVTAPLDDATYSEGDAAGEGVLVHLPSQVRTLVFIPAAGTPAPRTGQRWTERLVRERYADALERERALLAEVHAELAAERRAAEERVVAFDGPRNEAGEYQPDERTVMLLHFNGRFEHEPQRVVGQVEFVPGRFGTQAAHFAPDAGALFRLPANLNWAQGAIECWVRPDWPTRTGRRHTIADIKGPGEWNENRLMLHKNLDHEVAFVIWDRSRTALSVRVPINILRQHRWTHLCGTWDAARGLRFYVNGELVGEAEGTLDIARFDTLAVGNNVTFDRPWEGVVEELRLSSGERQSAP